MDPDPDPAPGTASEPHRPAVTVVTPGLLVSVTVERSPAGGDEIHIHPAGQGFWAARAARDLGADTTLCCVRGGETGATAVDLIDAGIVVRCVATDVPTGAYVDDRRDGERQRVATMRAMPLDRHTIDDLIGITVAEGLRSGTVIVTGTNQHGSVPSAFFTTVTSSLHTLGTSVIVDLSGAELHAALAGHVDAVKVSHTELIDAGFATDDRFDSLRDGARKVADTTGADVFVTCAGDGAFVHTVGETLVGRGPQLDTVEHRGAGDSFTAAVAVARCVGLEPAEQLRMAMATAAANVLRRGLGSATVETVHAIGVQVEVDAA